MKKALYMLLTAALICGLLTGCAPQDGKEQGAVIPVISRQGEKALVGNIPVAFPLVQKPATLNVLITGGEGRDQKDVYVWQKYADMTGVSINWTTVDKEARGEIVQTALTNRQNVDMILRCKLSAHRLTQYGQSGLLLDLAKDDLLKNNAPNCWAYLQSHPDTLASVTNPDGAIYALPQVNSGAELRVSRKIFINKQWLERVGMPVPKTTEELYALLKAFKEQDANGNGDKNDELPLCSLDWLSLQEALYGAFGLGNRGVHNLSVDCDEQTGRARLISASDGYKDFLTYFHRLYAEGLLDSRQFTMTMAQWSSNAQNDLIGAFASTNLASLPADRADNWVAIDEALEGPNGDKLWAAVRANFHSTGAAAIPAVCSDPALCLRWLDYFWTDEGTLFYHMGVEGETYYVREDGSYDYLPAIYEKMANQQRSFDSVISEISPYPGGSNPTVEIAPYFMGGEMAIVPAQAARGLFRYGPKEYWPSFTFTKEETDVLDALRGDINKYENAMCIEFITGEKPLTEWSEYLAQLERRGADKILAVYQAAADRYREMTARVGE